MIIFQCSIKIKKNKSEHIDNLSKLFVGYPDGNKEIASQESVFVIYSFVYLPIYSQTDNNSLPFSYDSIVLWKEIF